MNKVFELKSKFKPTGDQPQAIKEITKKFEEGSNDQILLGVTGSGKTFTMANIIQNLGKKTLILAHNKTLAAQLYGEFKEFFPNNAVEYFVSYYDYYQPEAYVVSSDTYIEKDSSVNDEIDKLRHSATKSLLSRDDVIVVSSVSCIYGIGSPDEYLSQKCTLFKDEEVNLKDFLRDLVSIQYERNDVEFSRGCFRARGDIVEVFPPSEDSKVIRLEFFDNYLEAISIVDPLRGTLIEELDKITIFPKSHYVVSEKRLKKAIKTISEELRDTLNELEGSQKLVEKQRLEQRTLLDLEMLEEMGFCSGIENYSRHLTGAKAGDPPPTLIDYFGDDFLLIVDESHMTIGQVRGMYRGDRARKMNLVDFGFRLPSALDNRPLEFEEFEQKRDRTLYVSATPGDYELDLCHGEYVEQLIRPTGLLDPPVEVKDAKYQVDDLLKEIKIEIEKGGRILVTSLTKKLAEELSTFYKGVGIKVAYLHSDVGTIERMEIIKSLREGEIDVLVGINLLREGLDIPEVTLVAILDADKEGFLRSEKSLIQTMGRAARNAQGRVILYAYKQTQSMMKAMAETARRRELQAQYNKEHGIIPKTIIKEISGGIIETLRGRQKSKKSQKLRFESLEDFEVESLEGKIKELTLKMKEASRELRFEDAAKIRDEIKFLKEARLLI